LCVHRHGHFSQLRPVVDKGSTKSWAEGYTNRKEYDQLSTKGEPIDISDAYCAWPEGYYSTDGKNWGAEGGVRR
jgi:hypothetical protein